ncbi:MAG: sigma-70 family RNA polymerase sigma factor [Planctomycetia bacterium]|nr:sigma-70 family RNA polymerase sigma factor [Planctomycetia bacterium]
MTSESQNGDKSEQARKIFLEQIDAIRVAAFKAAPNHSLIGDIVNDVFVRFVENAEKWDYSGNCGPLLRQITANIALEYWREHLRHQPESLQNVAEYTRNLQEENINDRPTRAMKLKALELCMENLSAEHRELLEAHYIKGVPIKELAELFHKNVNALYSFFTRIRNVLEKCVESKLEGELADVEL